MNPEEEPAVIPAEKMDLGVEDMLFIDIYQEKRNYHLQDCCVGRVDFAADEYQASIDWNSEARNNGVWDECKVLLHAHR